MSARRQQPGRDSRHIRVTDTKVLSGWGYYSKIEMATHVEAQNIAYEIAGDETNVELWDTGVDNGVDNSWSFKYEGGPINSHKVPDDWQVMGFSQDWFTLEALE